MISQEKIQQILDRFDSLQVRMADQAQLSTDEYVRLSKEYAEMSTVVEAAREFQRAREDVAGLGEILADADSDAEMRELAREELEQSQARLPALEQSLQLLLLPKDEADERNAILEVRAGTGGDEAALFAANLLRMYERYADLHGWKFELMHHALTDIGGCKEAQASITGRDVFARLKYESGVHRVQRVPVTESGGRIHTSAATVAVLPEADEVDIKVEEKDLRIDVFRASGPGGQSVNTTDSAVRITHMPTGIVVQQQDEKSQHKNRAKAMKVLRARLYERERQERDAARAEERRSQIGTGDRSERVRTYNFPQNRVTDHRINFTSHRLEKILEGEALDEVIDALTEEDQASRLAQVGNDA